MKKIPNSSSRLSEHILRALNKIRKPSTAGEITELVNRDLDVEERPFQVKDVAEWGTRPRPIQCQRGVLGVSQPKVRGCEA